MADIADLANDQADYFLELALARHVAAPVLESAKYCVDCDEPIPALRREHVPGVQTCVDCQGIREMQGVRRG